MLSGLIGAALAVTITSTQVLPINRIVVNDSPGPQIDPHVSLDLVSYSSFAGTDEIRYFRFSTGVDLAITNADPDGGRTTDQLSDVNGNDIVFSRTNAAGTENDVMFFDTVFGSLEPIELNGRSDTNRNDVALGGRSSAYVDRTNMFIPQQADVWHFDRITGKETQLSTSGLEDYDPQVSPDGRVIVWQRCEQFGALLGIGRMARRRSTQSGPCAAHLYSHAAAIARRTSMFSRSLFMSSSSESP